jgi:hypothetical protein
MKDLKWSHPWVCMAIEWRRSEMISSNQLIMKSNERSEMISSNNDDQDHMVVFSELAILNWRINYGRILIYIFWKWPFQLIGIICDGQCNIINIINVTNQKKRVSTLVLIKVNALWC